MSGDDENRLKALLAEYNWLGHDQKLYNQFLRTDARLCGTLLAILVLAPKSTFWTIPTWFIAAIPSVIFLSTMLALSNVYAMMTEIDRRAEIEREINSMLNSKSMLWESERAPERLQTPKAPTMLFVYVLGAFLLLVFVYFCWISNTVDLKYIWGLHLAELGIIAYTLRQTFWSPHRRTE